MLIKKQKNNSFIILIIVFVIIFYYMLRVTTLVELNNGNWNFDIFSTCLNELYKITTPISITTQNVAISIGVAFFVLMLYETYTMQNKKNIQENTYRFCRMEKYKGYKKQKR